MELSSQGDAGGLSYRIPLRTALFIVGIWLLLGVFFGLQIYANVLRTQQSTGGDAITLFEALRHSVGRYAIYALLTFPIIWLCRRFPLTSAGWRSFVAAHAAGLVGFNLLYTGLRLLTTPPVETARGTYRPLPVNLHTAESLIIRNLFDQFWMYCSIVVVVLAVHYYSSLRQRELHTAEMQRRMAEYELQILKLQLHPHFLFNTLNGISTLMTRDTRTAREMLVRLSDLFRTALAHTAAKEVSLREELEFVEAYLQLEKMRFEEKLTVQMQIDPETLGALVPNMLLQPLVENAVRHGVAKVRGGGTVELGAARVNGRLRITITNDGPPVSNIAGVSEAGVGLSNTRARLSQLYGNAYDLRLAARTQGGALLSLEIPYRDSPCVEGDER